MLVVTMITIDACFSDGCGSRSFTINMIIAVTVCRYIYCLCLSLLLLSLLAVMMAMCYSVSPFW